ncbi:MAG: RIP metalloprotease RseP [Gammaproteobacteria bacterium]|nr:MAG: RIP metalloprotease RseP [Gammaproteobacteria bacterium]
MNILLTILIFLFTLIILVAVHECGHFWVARKMGVRVLRFAIGMGSPIFKFIGKKDKTEYALCPIPLGGYVKMLGEDSGEKLSKKDQKESFSHKSVWARIAIVSAGPIANFILAIFVLWLMYFIGISGIKPIIGDIAINTPAYSAKLQSEDTITHINNKKTHSWSSTQLLILEQALKSDKIKITVDRKNEQSQEFILEIKNKDILKESQNILQQLGISVWMPKIKAIIGEVSENSPAAIGGMLSGDTVIKINEVKIDLWQDMTKIIQNNPGQELSIMVQRNKNIKTLKITPKIHTTKDKIIGRMGVSIATGANKFDNLRVKESYSMVDSLTMALDKTYQLTTLTFKMLGKLITGNADLKNVSGPITIAVYAKQSAMMGFDHYLFFVALISLSLGILNLLPVPILDGGHLMFYIIEAIKGSPVSDKMQIIGQKIGILLLGSLMILAFYNDIVRL